MFLTCILFGFGFSLGFPKIFWVIPAEFLERKPPSQASRGFVLSDERGLDEDGPRSAEEIIERLVVSPSGKQDKGGSQRFLDGRLMEGFPVSSLVERFPARVEEDVCGVRIQENKDLSWIQRIILEIDAILGSGDPCHDSFLRGLLNGGDA